MLTSFAVITRFSRKSRFSRKLVLYRRLNSGCRRKIAVSRLKWTKGKNSPEIKIIKLKRLLIHANRLKTSTQTHNHLREIYVKSEKTRYTMVAKNDLVRK
jgi:hypothetical protein